MKHVQLTEGRRLSWPEWGAENGREVLFCPGAGMGGLFPFGEDVAVSLGLRLLSIDRPGLGWSDSDPQKTFTRWVGNFRQWLAAVGRQAIPLVAFSQGAPFAFALAAAGLAPRLSIVAGQDELTDPRSLTLLPEPVAGFVQRATSDPEGLEAEIVASASAEWLWSMIDAMSSPGDRASYTGPDFAPAYRAALEAGFRNGAAGYARDTVLAMSRRPFRL